ncbi:amino acid transporter heavy chain SLC3A2 [Panulirus ornatus]|uniref:amino acid transporter heavy chain SLC3A2 n=1 Tax=Panulirus ornatus TaxID=150431 RepID=UPI003A8B3809
MTEEKNGAANTEMAPQEDGTKVPLTNDCPEVKFTPGSDPPNGDAKIDMLEVQAFSGLTKEELMKYSSDPFWVRLRWALFVIFWLGWLTMLVLAIVIIVQAPRCVPETLDWVQESPMIQYDLNSPVDVDSSGVATPSDLVQIATELGLTTVYLESLISPKNFEDVNSVYDKKVVEEILEATNKAELHVVTDFVQTHVVPSNNWYQNPNMSDFFKPNSDELDFSNPDLLKKLTELLSDTWVKMGVKGFLVERVDTEDLVNASMILDTALESVDGAVVHGVVDMASELVTGFNANKYRSFLDDHINDWTYYKFNPKVAESVIPADMVRLVTLSLFLVPGTPILDGFDQTYFEAQKDVIKSLAEVREKESVKLGNMTFAETDEDVVAYVRVMKGTPGYAVAVNMHSSNNATIDFSAINGVSEKGDNHIKSTQNSTVSSTDLGQSDMKSVYLEPYEGIVIQFVPNF